MKRRHGFMAALLLGCAGLLPAAAPGNQDLREGTTAAADYLKRPLRGFDVRIHPQLTGDAPHAAVGTLAVDALDRDLGDLVDQLPGDAIALLRKVPLYLGVSDPAAPCACYHPDAHWLTANGFDPEKARSVEITSAATFLEWRRSQPSMVLHELAHAFHHREHPGAAGRIAMALVEARESGRYDSVLRWSGARDSHYAMTDSQEYFAETTEALFGVNDFAPFVRAELIEHDPDGARLVAELWGAPELVPQPDPAEDAVTDPMKRRSIEDLATAEIAAMHARFEAWFAGGAASLEFSTIEDALGPEFLMINPSGRMVERDELVLALRTSAGKRQVTLSTQVRHMERLGEDRVLAVYEESQLEGETRRLIVSTALFKRDPKAPGGVQWLHVHETFGAR